MWHLLCCCATSLLECRRLLCPGLELVMPPINKVVHVLEKLFPSHHPWSWIWWDESCTLCTVWISADLFAHILTHACKFALQSSPVLQIRFQACLVFTL